ncbi:transposase [Streptomyces sp. NBC_00258]|uniref:transposase n=1 Tax=Streptomyces sp. NBC_00258 TaxID=2903642 RepID=UPI002E2A0054|nr:transposase [Streptomyces sp. NBC_00258]
MPQDVRERPTPDHLCWKVLDVIDQLDLTAFVHSYRDDRQGRAAYPPQTLIALLLYCYGKGIRSSRKIEQACFDDVGCRIIAANRRGDHSTLARFIRRHRAALKLLFVQVLAVCGRQQGLLNLAAVAVDGSPMDANAVGDGSIPCFLADSVAVIPRPGDAGSPGRRPSWVGMSVVVSG